MAKLSITNLTALMDLARTNQTILTLPSFTAFQTLYNEILADGSGCRRCKNKSKINAFVPTFKIVVQNIDDFEIAQLKQMFGVSKIVLPLYKNGTLTLTER